MANKIRQFSTFKVTDPPGTGAFGDIAANMDISGYVKSFQFSVLGRPLRTVGVGTYTDARLAGRLPPLDLTVIAPSSLSGLLGGTGQTYEFEIVQDLTHEDGAAAITETWEVDAILATIELPAFAQSDDDQDTTYMFNVLTMECAQSDAANVKIWDYDKTSTPQKFECRGESIF